ncbi:PqqD family protein [Lederbergia ruris]|uniref:PqqD family protein n=1 Tax=Lederbergia ruris TaxID=217495 RepID=UPI0039A0D551
MLRKDVFWQPVGDELVVFTITGDNVFSINQSGSIVMQMLAEGQNTQQISAKLSETYGDSIEVCDQVTNSFIEKLREEGLIE